MRKGLIKNEICKGGNPQQTVQLILQANTAIAQFLQTLPTPEDLKPREFAPVAVWYEILKTIYDRI
jgi:hypothetical protein